MRGARVLVVEDEPLIAMMPEDMLAAIVLSKPFSLALLTAAVARLALEPK